MTTEPAMLSFNPELMRLPPPKGTHDIRTDPTYPLRVQQKLNELRLTGDAAELYRAEQAGDAPPFDAGTLAEMQARAPDPPHRVEGLIPSDAATLIPAMRKTGKTTALANLAQSLITGENFLGCYPTRKISGRVAFMNFEVSWSQITKWASDVGIPPDRMLLLNLRGRRNPLDNDEDRAELARLLRSHEVESLIIDPFGRAYTGKSQNDAGEVGAWLAGLDRFARGDAGVSDVILSAHAGWEGERTRGSSALEDWADSILTMTRHKDDPTRRFLKAEGRDVSMEEDELAFDPATRRLTVTGYGSRRVANANAHEAELAIAIVAIVAREPGLITSQLEAALRSEGHGFQRGDVGRAGRRAVADGLLTTTPGARNAVHYFPAAVVPSSPESSRREHRSSPDPSLVDGTTTTTTQPPSAPGAIR